MPLNPARRLLKQRQQPRLGQALQLLLLLLMMQLTAALDTGN
jgi:hypothetical protein